MNRRPKSNARKVWAIVLIVYACIGLVFMPGMIARMNTRFNPVMLLPYALILLVGILLLPKKPREMGDFWRTEDPARVKKVIRKLDKVKSDSALIRVGGDAPLDEVARAAFQRVQSQKEISSYIRYNINDSRRLLALEYLNDDHELKEIAVKCKEPIASAALERMRSEKLIAELAASSGTELGLKAVERLNDPGLLTALANDDGAPQQVRREALRKLGKPALADGLLLASPGTNDADGRRAADHILETKDPAQIAWAAEMLCKAEKAPTPAGRDFLSRAAAEWPDALLPLGMKTWSNGCGDIIRAAAWEAQGCVTQADQLRLSSLMFSTEEKRKAGKRLLETQNDVIIRQSVQQVLRNPQDAGNKAFVLEVAQARPELIQELWPKVREWGHVDKNEHTDYTKSAPHVDSTRYYDFFRYPDGRTVPNRSGRKSHTDGPMPSSDCAEYGHTDVNRHTDNAELLEKGYLACFPKAVRGED